MGNLPLPQTLNNKNIDLSFIVNQKDGMINFNLRHVNRIYVDYCFASQIKPTSLLLQLETIEMKE
ncbi:hypothetical protein NIES2100_17610 [Calothrix sp. NIES-2100]|nr:hypothetical protein NIES2100_17610 [Calothrix sp. NIES-2100]